MFDLTSGKLLLLGIVALIVLGPKDFPILLRTIGKYMGIIKRQADEFREQFNEAIRESEFDQIKKDVEGLGQDLDTTMRDTQQSITQDFESIRTDIDEQLNDPLKTSPHTDSYTPIGIDEPAPQSASTEPAVADPDAHDANGIPFTGTGVPEPVQEHAAVPVDRSLNGSGNHAETKPETPEPAPKSGA
jgi:sec-independent protein translocase protein TatB